MLLAKAKSAGCSNEGEDQAGVGDSKLCLYKCPCVCTCVCASAEQYEGSVVVSGNTPTPALIQLAPAMKAVQVCNLASRVHPRPQWSEQQPPAEVCVQPPAAITASTPAQTYLLRQQFPKCRQKATTPHPLPLTWLTALRFFCALEEIWT